jgi:predicted transglutaminase-like cysteine proteinase
MLRVVSFALIGLVGLASATSAEPAPTRKPQATQASPFMKVFGSALPPFGFVEFCERVPSECVQSGSRAERFDATPELLSVLDSVNVTVNKSIAPATDQELYGVAEHWTIPVDSGDCEDYALLKRQVLINMGWPSSALLMTVVRDERGDGHAVLTVRTSQGDFILDNKYAGVKLWNQTNYRFIMRQSYVDPRLWMSLSADDTGRSTAITSLQAKR